MDAVHLTELYGDFRIGICEPVLDFLHKPLPVKDAVHFSPHRIPTINLHGFLHGTYSWHSCVSSHGHGSSDCNAAPTDR
jgi:hypothetical protein